MPLMRSVRRFLRRVKQDGLQCVPGVVHARWMTLVHRDLLTAEAARRRAEAVQIGQQLSRQRQGQCA